MNYRVIIILVLISFSCNKDDDEDNMVSPAYSNGLLVLNEGLFQQNNSTLSWIDLSDSEVTNQVFLSENNRPLGDTGNDMAIYGSKLYILVNASSTVEVLEANSLKSIKQIQMQYNGQGQQPRQIEFYDGRAYISSYDGHINILDTNSLTITDRIVVGENPEGLAIHNQNIYVTNSGGLSFPNVDSTVYKIDINSNQVIDTFVVGNNPGDIVADSEGDVYVVKRGDYSANDPSELIRIYPNGTVDNLGIPASTLSIIDDQLYISYYDYDTGVGSVSLLDMNSESIINNSLIEGTSVETLYGITLSSTNELYAFDAMNFTNSGYIRKFNASGALIESFHVGLNPTKVIIYE